MRRFLFIGWFTIIMIACVIPAFATHIVGGEVTYKCLGLSGAFYKYEITIIIYEDCLTGQPDAIAQDDPAYVSIFQKNTNGQYTQVVLDSIGLGGNRITVPANFNNQCVKNPPPTCLKKATFIKDFLLPPNNGGYTVVYQRCCRNGTIVNILDPGETGATYYCVIPPTTAAACNTSPVFKNYPPQIICINNPIYYDHSATEPDGDSLSYSFCRDYGGGGATATNAKPYPTSPPFNNVFYQSPYSYLNPMGGNPRIKIDPQTGIITGTPNLLGRFVVAVCCVEWRHGVILDSITREFQFVVTNCSKAVVADMPQFSDEPNTYIVDCKDYKVHFVNTSQGGFSYDWDFGDPANPQNTSTDFEPDHAFSDTGTYVVKLVVNKGSTCPDSISRLVKVYPSFTANFSFAGMQCPGATINFTDLSTGTYKPINSWEWHFGDGDTSTLQNPSHIYEKGGAYNAILVSGNVKGCVDTVAVQVGIANFLPFAGSDTIIVKGESIQFDATGGDQYTWTPSTQLNDPNIGDPIGYYPDTGRYAYVVHVITSYGCDGYDTVKVRVVGQPSYFVPSAFSPNGDGLNDRLKPITVGYRSIDYFRIFNRWGEEVFYTDELDEGWDGTYHGQPAEIGTYFWMLSIQDRQGKGQKLKGDVTLIR